MIGIPKNFEPQRWEKRTFPYKPFIMQFVAIDFYSSPSPFFVVKRKTASSKKKFSSVRLNSKVCVPYQAHFAGGKEF